MGVFLLSRLPGRLPLSLAPDSPSGVRAFGWLWTTDFLNRGALQVRLSRKDAFHGRLGSACAGCNFPAERPKFTSSNFLVHPSHGDALPRVQGFYVHACSVLSFELSDACADLPRASFGRWSRKRLDRVARAIGIAVCAARFRFLGPEDQGLRLGRQSKSCNQRDGNQIT